MALTTQFHAAEPIYFDFALLRKAFLYFALGMLFMAPLSRDPLVVVACGSLPWVLVALVDRPRMPSVVIFYLLYMWVEAAVRVLIASIDGESLGDGPYGLDVYRAFWYSMTSLIVLCRTISLLNISAGRQYDSYAYIWQRLRCHSYLILSPH
jgi:hypothetical protein